MAVVAAVEVKETRATVLGEAEAHLSASYCDHRLTPEDKTGAVDFRHRSMQFGESGFNCLQYGHEVSVSSRGFEEFYMLEMPTAGGVDIAFGEEKVRSEPGKALILSPGPKFRSRWRQGTQQWMLQIDRKLVEARMARVVRRNGRDNPVFNPVIDLKSAHGRRLAGTVQTFSEILTDNAQPPERTAIDAVLASVVDELLRNIAFTSGASVVPERLYATPRHVKQAMEALKARYAERLLVPVLAGEIGVSERALYEGFQICYQRTPHEMLTRIRMEAARQLIRDAGLSAAEAARSVGMPHTGRFSAAYRQTFGVLPSADLRRDH